MGVTDPKKRKQIQDRLAQRARRNASLLTGESGKRLALAKKQNVPAASQLVRRKEQIKPDEIGIHPAFISGLNRADDSESLPLMPIPLNVYSALYKNGTFLGLACSNCVPCLSAPAGPDVPESLRPTSVQLMTIHPPWIDRFPFPKMRENFIMLLGVVDPEEFLCDMFNGPSFTLEGGGASWDPKVWSIEESFRNKWGFLFDKDLFGA
ncbi:hypothetical protein M409DRAFT_68445 [Zasmidium cellare ATCC 36951]|uniref:Uncharacterized protein n=1 Tax=Zasmidium cellare ATCC 36951 TaxID=1080233 RepID=A0A6A6C8Q0_ZASCE|nr:uncharacterized protein M409DRAFT_68445 [Zasmidium cellare ATCC 36951]KAF2163524.1 hypothetical protein M409DRAFT_68445 [Zasmidium cellare ATCC 36951]